MGKISEIPKLRKSLDERMAKLGGEGVGMSDKTAEVFFDGRRVGHVSSVTFRAPTLPEDPSDGPSSMTAQFANENAALLAENSRLSDRVAELQAELRRRTTRFDPATGREEPWDPDAKLREVRDAIPADIDCLRAYTLAGAVEWLGRMFLEMRSRAHSAEKTADANTAVLSSLRSQRVEPGSLVTLSAPENTDAKALKRLGDALHKALAERIGLSTYGAPTVVLLPPGGQAQVISPQGRGPVQVQIREPGAPARPTDVPKHVAQAYAECAAASYGVTPAVVRAKRASRRLLRAVANRVNARIAEDISPFITAEIRRENRPIGREIIAYDDPAELMLADAEG